MHRLRLQLPIRQQQHYSHYDLLHDALINGLIAAGASPEMLMGFHACPWNFAALGTHRDKVGYAHSLIISTPDTALAQVLDRLQSKDIHKTRGYSQERVDFSAASITVEADPIPPVQGIMSVLLLSPLLIQDRRSTKKQKQWHTDLNHVALSDAVNHRLSRLAQRDIKLIVQADPLYLRANPNHATCIKMKQFANGQASFALGMQAPLMLSGSEDDLRFAWYAGIGEKNRNGFGCLGLLEQGVGR